MEPYEAREIAAKAWCDSSTSHLDMIPELAEAFAKILVEEVGKASPASAPEGWKHSCNALCLDGVELWIPQCPHCGKPAPTPPVSEDRKDAEIERLALYKNLADEYGLSVFADLKEQAERVKELEAQFQQTHEWLCDRNQQIHEQSAALKLASLALSEGVEYVEEPPEKNCSCHLSPPCNDCVDHSAVREFFIDARKALAAIDALGENNG